MSAQSAVSATVFDRDSLADWYAAQHLQTDPGVRVIYYLKANAPAREIRFVEVNDLIAERSDSTLQALDFGVNIGSEIAHTLLVLDVTPNEWKQVETGQLELPPGWSLDDAQTYHQDEACCQDEA